jgi:hypothetical protein
VAVEVEVIEEDITVGREEINNNYTTRRRTTTILRAEFKGNFLAHR